MKILTYRNLKSNKYTMTVFTDALTDGRIFHVCVCRDHVKNEITKIKVGVLFLHFTIPCVYSPV